MSQCHAIKFLSAFTALQDSFLLRKACFTFAKAITAVSTVPNSSGESEKKLERSVIQADILQIASPHVVNVCLVVLKSWLVSCTDIAEHGNRNILNSVAELSTDANRTPCYLLPGHVLRGVIDVPSFSRCVLSLLFCEESVYNMSTSS